MRRFVLSGSLAMVVAAMGFGVAGSSVPSHVLKSGQRVVFRSGSLRIGSSVSWTCGSFRIAVRVPRRGQRAFVIADGLKGSATIRLTTRADGSVVASCS
jgi:hypothetical protein